MSDLTVKEFASMGGKARAKALTPAQRSEISRKAGLSNLEKYGNDYFKKIRQGLKVKDF